MWRIYHALILSCLLVLQACGGSPTRDDEEGIVADTDNWTAEKLYQESRSAMDHGAYDEAIRLLEKLEARYPFGRYAQQAQLEIIYANYRREEPTQAIAAADLFIKLHPRHQHVDYAYYLRGLASFKLEAGFFEELMGKDPADIDPGGARRAFGYFAELVKNYPDSRYAQDARKRMVYLRNLLASYELKVARYYFDKNAYVAAANRAKYIIEHYQGTDSVTGAVKLLAQSYQLLEMTELARDSQRVFELNKGGDQAGP